MTNKLLEIDMILASLEDDMHGEDGKKISKARKLIIEILEYEKTKHEMITGNLTKETANVFLDK